MFPRVVHIHVKHNYAVQQVRAYVATQYYNYTFTNFDKTIHDLWYMYTSMLTQDKNILMTLALSQ